VLARILVCLVLASPAVTHSDYRKQETARLTGLDDELAHAVAHQLAHQVQGSTMNISTDDEARADRLALYMVAASGFDISSAPAFWDRLTAVEPWKVLFDNLSGRRLHIAMPARAIAIREAVAEIREKVANEEPLVP
jgi:hypothetical protein